MSMADPAATQQKFVAGARSAALQVPVDPRATADAAPAASESGTDVLEIALDGYPVTIRPTEASVREVIGTAYLIGGFELVQALDRAVRERVRIEGLSLSQLKAAVQRLPSEARRRPSLKDVYDRAMAEQLAKIRPTERRLQTATDVLRLLHVAWERIAAAEEQVLREYEPFLVSQFVALADEARALALKEWTRYEPYDSTETDPQPLTMSEAAKRSTDDLRLRNEADVLCRDIRKLHEAWMAYRDSVEATNTLVGMGARRLRSVNPGSDPAQAIAYSRAGNADKFKAFDEHRTDIGTRFPVALQVYGKVGTRATSALTTTKEEIQGWVIEALTEAVESAQGLADEGVKNRQFKADTQMRVPAASTGDAASELPSYQQTLLSKGLTIPASRVIANRLSDVDDAAKSPWFQLPVRLALYRRGTEGDMRLSVYTTPGRLHHAALSEVNNALQEVRRKQKETTDQALLIMDAIAVPAGFFTGGATMAVAGVIHAVVRANEMYLSVGEYLARDELAQIALVPLQQALWEHPSAVTLTAKLLEGGFEIASDLISTGVAGAIMDAIQVSLTLGYGVEAVAEWVAGDDPLEDDS